MTFEIGTFVKWTGACPTRLGFSVADIGKVVGVYEYSSLGCEIDVAFGNGDVVRGAAQDWFEPVPQEDLDGAPDEARPAVRRHS
jgi:hypothetical protein